MPAEPDQIDVPTMQQQIRQRMEEMGIERRELAARMWPGDVAGDRAGDVSRMLTGNPTARTLQLAAAALGLRWVLSE